MKTNKIIEDAKVELEKILADPEVRYLVEAREKQLKDINSALYNAEKRGEEKGLEKGIKEGIKQTAKAMKEKGIDINTISDVTGLSKEEIEKL